MNSNQLFIKKNINYKLNEISILNDRPEAW